MYAEKYLRGHKSVDTAPTTVVEFIAPKELIATLFATQHKVTTEHFNSIPYLSVLI